jgi:hypothetical protein
MAENGKKPFYKKPLWISIMAIFVFCAAASLFVDSCNKMIVTPARAAVASIAADTAKKLDRPIKKVQRKIMLEQVRIRAYQEAGLNSEQKAVAETNYRRDSVRIINMMNEDEE